MFAATEIKWEFKTQGDRPRLDQCYTNCKCVCTNNTNNKNKQTSKKQNKTNKTGTDFKGIWRRSLKKKTIK